MNKFAQTLKSAARSIALKGTNLVTIDAQELADLRLRALDNARNPTTPLTKAELTMKQLGSYVPNFETLSAKPDEFKNRLGRVCRDLMLTEEWQYLINHLKQDQVNISLFTEGIKHTDDWVRGSINGIYVVEDQIQLLGTNYEQRLKEGMLGKKPEAKK